MKHSTGASAEAPSSWLSSLVSCYTPLLGRDRRGFLDDNQFPVVRNQPLPHPTPVPTPETECCEMAWKEEDCSNARRPQPSGKRKAAFEAASRRPLISAPSNFRHLHSGSSHLGRFRSPLQLQPCFAHHAPLVRPLDRGILCVPEGQVTLHMDLGGVMTPPPPAYMARHLDGDDHELLAQSNFSPLSFHVPRRRVTATCTSIDGREGLTLRVPPRAQGRARPYTAPQMEAIKERVASAMIEAERLQQQIDEIMERQSFYANSRPSTPHPIARGAPALPEPMPSIPARPPEAPSFAQRLQLDAQRCLTATAGSASVTAVSVAAAEPPRTRNDEHGPPRLPPLPFRPPLRKKKSFSDVSN